jgi:hypothetical protein
MQKLTGKPARVEHGDFAVGGGASVRRITRASGGMRKGKGMDCADDRGVITVLGYEVHRTVTRITGGKI